MKIVHYLTKPIRHPWRTLCLAVFLIVATMLLIPQRNPHDVSAKDYATLMFNGLVNSNGVEYGSFTITNHHQHPLSFYVNNIEIRTREGWTYYAKWSPGSSGTHPTLGTLNNPPVSSGQAQSFLIPSPSEGDAWRIHVGVLRGIQGLTLKNRAAILFQTRSPSAALTSNKMLTKGYNHFTFAGMLDGPPIPSTAQDGPANGSQPIRTETN